MTVPTALMTRSRVGSVRRSNIIGHDHYHYKHSVSIRSDLRKLRLQLELEMYDFFIIANTQLTIQLCCL